jgi:hypothetical protein
MEGNRCGRRIRGASRAGAWLGSLAVAIALSAAPAAAQLQLGVQASNGERSGFGIGPRVQFGLGPLTAGLRVAGSFEVFPGDSYDLPDEGEIEADLTYWEANVNVHYVLGLPAVPLKPYVGAGLNLAHLRIEGTPNAEFDQDETRRGLNLLAGAGLALGSVTPFVEYRIEIEGGEQWVLSGGILF